MANSTNSYDCYGASMNWRLKIVVVMAPGLTSRGMVMGTALFSQEFQRLHYSA